MVDGGLGWSALGCYWWWHEAREEVDGMLVELVVGGGVGDAWGG